MMKGEWCLFYCNSRFSCDVTAAMLVYRTIAKKIFWEFDSIITQNLSDILPLFCTPTWPSHYVSEILGCWVMEDFDLCKLDDLWCHMVDTKWNEITKYGIFVQILSLWGWNFPLEGGKLWFNISDEEGLEPTVLPWNCHSGHFMDLRDD